VSHYKGVYAHNEAPTPLELGVGAGVKKLELCGYWVRLMDGWTLDDSKTVLTHSVAR